MRIGTIPLVRRLQRRIRQRRLEILHRHLSPDPRWKILDVGGTPPTWRLDGMERFSVTLLNLSAPLIPAELRGRLTGVEGDATALEFDDDSFDLAYSNSVIEHVGTFENQKRFAREIRRVAPRIWVQTPAREFFFEPHYITPFIHWVPLPARRRLIRWCTTWGLFGRPSKRQIEDRLKEIRLLRKDEMHELFPDCVIHEEKFLGMTKSYIAIRTPGPQTGARAPRGPSATPD